MLDSGICVPGGFYSSSDGDAAFLIALINFIDGTHEACITEEEVLAVGEGPVLLDGRGHHLLEARVDNIDLFCSLNGGIVALKAHHLEKFLLRALIELLRELSWGNVIEVLQPLEIRDGDSTTVHE